MGASIEDCLGSPAGSFRSCAGCVFRSAVSTVYVVTVFAKSLFTVLAMFPLIVTVVMFADRTLCDLSQ